MLKFIAILLCGTVVSCSTPIAESTSTASAPTTSLDATTTTSASTTTSTPVDCPAAPYELNALPFGVGQGLLDPDEIEPDVWTSVGGSNTTFWGNADGAVAIALIRGALPAVDWPAEKGEVFVDGTRAAVGPHLDGTWVAGWFEEPRDRCDLYTMVFYPPVAPQEVEKTLDGMNRVGG